MFSVSSQGPDSGWQTLIEGEPSCSRAYASEFWGGFSEARGEEGFFLNEAMLANL